MLWVGVGGAGCVLVGANEIITGGTTLTGQLYDFAVSWKCPM